MLKFKVTDCHGKLIVKFSVKNEHFGFMYALFGNDFTQSIQFTVRQEFTEILHRVFDSVDKINDIEAHLDDARVYAFYLSYYE